MNLMRERLREFFKSSTVGNFKQSHLTQFQNKTQSRLRSQHTLAGTQKIGDFRR